MNTSTRGAVAAMIAGAVALTALTGCTRATSVSQPDAPPAAASEAPVADPSFAPEPEPEPEVGNLPFGGAITYEDGVSLSLSTGAAFSPSEYVTVAQPHNLRFTVTITNGSDKNFDGYVYATATSGGAPAEQIFDSANGLVGSPSGVILPGQTISFDIAFSVADTNAIVVSIAPSFDYEDAIFTNVAG